MTERCILWVSAVFTVATMSLAPSVAFSQQETRIDEESLAVVSSDDISEIVSLSSFSAFPGPLRLRNASSEIDMFVPVSEIAEIVDVVLTLKYLNSIALLSDRSILSVRLNEATVAQVPLSDDQPQGSAKIRLPQQLWKSGFNKLTFSVAQHYADRCEDPQAPELWTEIDIGSSELDVTYRYTDVDYNISNLSDLVSPGFGGFESVRLATAADAAPEIIERGLPMVVQALALRRGYLPLSVETGYLDSRVSPAERASSQDPSRVAVRSDSGLEVLVGTMDELASQITPDDLQKVTGPSLLFGGGEGSAKLIVTGRNAAEVVSAAQNLSVIDDNLNPSSLVIFSEEDAVSPNAGMRRQLVPNRTYTFSELGVDTQTLGGSGPRDVVLPLPLPIDFYTYQGAEGELLLNFNYGAGMGPGSIFGVSVNDEFIHGLELNAENGAAFRDYRIVVPARLLRPGTNEIKFSFNLRPILTGGDCISYWDEYISAQVVGDSQLRLPPGGSAMILPDLALLAESGMPFGDHGSKEEDRIEVFAATADLYGAALTLIGKIAQTAGVAEQNVHLKTGIPVKTVHDAFFVAPQTVIPLEFFADWPVVIGETSRWPYSALENQDVVGFNKQGSGLDLLFQTIFGINTQAESLNEKRFATFRQRGDLGDLGIFAAFRNPWSEEFRTVSILSAADDGTLIDRIENLVSPGVWGQLRGDFVSWNTDEEVFATYVSLPEVVAPDNFWLRVRLILRQSPHIWLAVAGATVLLFVMSATILLRRRIKRLSQSE